MNKLGFRYDGKETMYNGVTGQRMKAKIFVGSLYYLKLNIWLRTEFMEGLQERLLC